MKTNVNFLLYPTQLFLEWEMFQTNLYGKSKHILCSIIFFFRKSFCLLDNVEKYGWAGESTDESKVHAHCILDT
jgi:hypothetical protein